MDEKQARAEAALEILQRLRAELLAHVPPELLDAPWLEGLVRGWSVREGQLLHAAGRNPWLNPPNKN